jgi:hypothetical protein
MKKYLVLFGAAVVMMALASPAVAQFTSWGHMEIQTIWEKAPDFNTGMPWQMDSLTGATNRDEAWRHVAQRYRFYLQYGDPKTVRAVIGFEADSTDWGQLANTSSTVTGGGMGVYRADQVQMEIKHAYLDFVIPNTPLSIMAGIQFWDVGGRIWMNNDAPGIRAVANFAPHKVTGWWWRENDVLTSTSTGASSRNTYSVNDTYGVMWEMAQQQFNAIAWGAYKNDLFTGNQSTVVNKYDDHPWTTGIGGGYRPGNWIFNGSLVYVGGKRDFKNFTGTGGSKSDYSNYAAELSAKYQIGPGMFVGLEGFYSSGQDANKNDKINLYQIPTGSEGQSIFGNDRTVFFWMNAAQMGYYHERNLGFMGLWYGRANFEYSPTAWVRMNLNYLYIGDNNKGDAGTGISAFTKVSGTKQINGVLGARQNEDLKYVGQEINLITTFNIYKNFTYNVGIYYFLPGTMYDRLNTAGTATVQSADNSYGINTKMVYAF